MGSLEFELLHPDFGARVRGISLVGEIADETVEEIKKAVDTYSLLCFPDQPMNDEAQIAFTRKLGEPEAEHVTLGKPGKSSTSAPSATCLKTEANATGLTPIPVINRATSFGIPIPRSGTSLPIYPSIMRMRSLRKEEKPSFPACASPISDCRRK